MGKGKKPRDLTEHQFLKAVKRHGMRVGGASGVFVVKGSFDLGISGRNIWEKLPEAWQKPKRRAMLAYMLAARERGIARVEAERAAYPKTDPELIYRSLPRGEDR